MVAVMRAIATFALVAILAGVSGYLGGTFGRDKAEAASVSAVKGSRFELVNGHGSTVATWSVEKNGAHIRFFSDRGTTPVDIGVLSDGRPYVTMSGRDGKRRVVIELDQHDKPILGMGDERWEGRVLLGFVEPDTYTPEWDNWGLAFHTFGSENPAASIGVLQTDRHAPEGVITLSGKRVQ